MELIGDTFRYGDDLNRVVDNLRLIYISGEEVSKAISPGASEFIGIYFGSGVL